MKKHLAVAVLAAALTVGGAMTSMAQGFVYSNQGVKYELPSGDFCTDDWISTHGHWFYFGPDQYMRTGWIEKDGDTYFAARTGELQSGLIKVDGRTYYMDGTTCKMRTGDIRIDHVTYYFPEDGIEEGGPYVYTEWKSDGTVVQGISRGSVR